MTPPEAIAYRIEAWGWGTRVAQPTTSTEEIEVRGHSY